MGGGMVKTVKVLVLFCCLTMVATSVRSEVKPQVKPYRVSTDLKEVTNLNQFEPTPEMQALLAKNLFVVVPASHEQPFFVYEDNDYRGVPSFVTVDSVLHMYHLFFDSALRQLEEEKLLPVLEDLTQQLLKQTEETYRKAPQGELKEAALCNLAYLSVAANLLGLESSVPEEAKRMGDAELKLIANHGGLGVGAILPYAIDYSQLVPRGHYTRSENLKRYFMAVMWYGLFPFAPRYRDSSGQLFYASRVTKQALLLTYDIYAARLTTQWGNLYDPIGFFVGFSDDLRPDEVKGLADKAFGPDADLARFADNNKFEKFKQLFLTFRTPQIRPKIAWIGSSLPPLPDPGTPQLRLLGQRYTPDSEILQELVNPITRPLPKGLDVMAVLDSPQAVRLLDTFYKKESEGGDYLLRRKELTERFRAVKKEQWTQNLYWNWLWVIKSLIQPSPEGYPSFMRTEAWQDKSLQGSLASWAELRHDTILYVKQSFSAAECGGDEEERPKPKGFVEANPEAFGRLLQLAQQTRNLLEPRGLLDGRTADKLREFEDMVSFLKGVAEKELTNQKLTENEYNQIRLIGSTMDYLSLWILTNGVSGPNGWYTMKPVDRNMACIADVHTAMDNRPGGVGQVVLEEGVGSTFEIYVIVPIEGKLYLTRGAVFSYYEFVHPMNNRLTDEKWQEMIGKEGAPAQPEWIRTFTVPKLNKLPVRAKPVHTGC